MGRGAGGRGVGAAAALKAVIDYPPHPGPRAFLNSFIFHFEIIIDAWEIAKVQ